jgi:hypothetical protein
MLLYGRVLQGNNPVKTFLCNKKKGLVVIGGSGQLSVGW